MDRNSQHRKDSRRYYEHDHLSHMVVNEAYFVGIDKARLVVGSIQDHSLVHVDHIAVWQPSSSTKRYALSQASSDKLAFNSQATVHIVDVTTSKIDTVFRSGSKVITSLCWSHSHASLACGSIDGSLTVWDLSTKIARSVRSARFSLGAIHCIAWSADSRGLIAFANYNGVHLWIKDEPAQRFLDFDSQEEVILHLAWSQGHPQRLLGASEAGVIYIWDLSSVVTFLQDTSKHALPSIRQHIAREVVSMSSHTIRFADIVYIRWMGEQKIGLLFERGKKFAQIDVDNPAFGNIAWELVFSHAYQAFTVELSSGREYVRMLSCVRQRLYPLPGRRDGMSTPDANETQAIAVELQSPVQHTRSQNTHSLRTMRPVPLAELAISRKPASYIEQQNTKMKEQHSLSVPKLLRAESGSAMPFLSPAIPAKAQKSTQAAVELTLPQASTEGYFGSFSSTSFHDSDSDDDEHFGIERTGKDKAGSPPGMVNVPLPRTCGAVFGHGDILLLFRPPRAKSSVVVKDDPLDEDLTITKDQRRAIALFPSFGNLLSSVVHSIIPAEVGEDPPGLNIFSALGLDNASYNSQRSWKPHSLPAGMPLSKPTTLPTIQVSVQQLVELSLPSRELALRYRTIRRVAETGSALCLANAGVAAESNCAQDAVLWQMLARVIEENDSRCAADWADHPLGSSWLIRRVYALAEAHANIQMLANVTAVLIGSADASRLVNLGELSDRLAILVRPQQSQTTSQPGARHLMPRLKTELSGIKPSRHSPSKTNINSTLSSRGPSQPTTPRLESSSSTPPWSFTSLTQAGSKAFMANSISPETSRGSFSAAVKSYAQSVSDKFASYGTSPPVRRSAASPHSELSSSLQGNSWTKSVSFASTTATPPLSNLSRRNTDVEDSYDSDRTIEDAVIVEDDPHDSASGVQLNWKNQDAFSDTSFGSAKTSLIPQDLLPKCSIWIQAYVQQLQSWRLNELAVTMAKIGEALLDHQDEQMVDSVSTKLTLVICEICNCSITGLKQVCPDCQHTFHMECLGALLDGSTTAFQCPANCDCCAFGISCSTTL